MTGTPFRRGLFIGAFICVIIIGLAAPAYGSTLWLGVTLVAFIGATSPMFLAPDVKAGRIPAILAASILTLEILVMGVLGA